MGQRGGFLGLDNAGPIDASHLPPGTVLEGADPAGWIGAYAVDMLTIARVLDQSGQRRAQGQVLKFLEHFAAVSDTIDSGAIGDDADGLYYGQLSTAGGQRVPLHAVSRHESTLANCRAS